MATFFYSPPVYIYMNISVRICTCMYIYLYVYIYILRSMVSVMWKRIFAGTIFSRTFAVSHFLRDAAVQVYIYYRSVRTTRQILEIINQSASRNVWAQSFNHAVWMLTAIKKRFVYSKGPFSIRRNIFLLWYSSIRSQAILLKKNFLNPWRESNL